MRRHLQLVVATTVWVICHMAFRQLESQWNSGATSGLHLNLPQPLTKGAPPH